MWRLGNITAKSQFSGRLRQVTGQEQLDANVEAMARDLQEILRIGAEQKRLGDVYEGR